MDGGLYVGNVDAGIYRPADDPHPNAFVICQVERCLNGLTEKHRAYAHKHFALGQSTRSIPGWRKLENEILISLSKQIRKTHFPSIAESAVYQARRKFRKHLSEETNG